MKTLPEKYLITGENPINHQEFIKKINFCLQSGFKLIQFRAKNLDQIKYNELAVKLIKLCRLHDATLIVNCDIENAINLKAMGIHLTSKRLMAMEKKPAGMLVGASCHDINQVNKAKALKLDFITLSPVLATKTHPEAESIGWTNFKKLAAMMDTPIYALGGLDASHLSLAKSHGAQGIAAIGAFWGR